MTFYIGIEVEQRDEVIFRRKNYSNIWMSTFCVRLKSQISQIYRRCL